MHKILFLIPIILVFLLVSSIPDSFAESEYALSHFSSKGKITNSLGEGTTVWTMVSGDKGTIVWTMPNSYSVARLDMQTHHMCYDRSNVVCLNGTVTSVKNTKFVQEDDIITLVYDMPSKQTVSFLSGNLVTNTFDLELTKFKAKEASKIVEQQAEKFVDELKKEVSLKILESLDFIKNELLLEKLIESNKEHYNLDDKFVEIEKRNQEWINAKPDVSPFEASIISNKVSDLLRDVMEKDSEKATKFVYKEIILANAYGANVAQTGPTTDYQQWDEQWWVLAKLEGIDLQSGFDESAGVQSFDVSLRITGPDGAFLGVIKYVINIE